MTDSLEVDDFPELSDVLSLFVAPGLSGERSRMPGSRIVGSVGGCSSSRGRVRSLASVSFSSDPETGQRTFLRLDISVHARRILGQLPG